MIDTHCHLTYEGLLERVDSVIADANTAGVDRMISVGTSPDDALKAVALAKDNPGVVYATAGLHPGYSDQWPDVDEMIHSLRQIISNHPVAALGEMGLDQHYPDPPMAAQTAAFGAQLDLARELAEAGRVLPIVIHNREATDATLAMIRESGLPGDRFVFHCFTGSADELDKILDLGARVSLTGIVTFNSARDLAEATDRIPQDRLMIETDSPYLTPAPHRKVRPNEPKFVPLVAAFLAQRRGMAVEDFTASCDANAQGFYLLGA